MANHKPKKTHHNKGRKPDSAKSTTNHSVSSNNKNRRRRNQSSLNNKSYKHHKNNLQTSQVRIIGGQMKRRQVDFYDIDGLRPTPDRMRETLFNWISPYLHDVFVLDCCAGSGVLGFEALSRGAAHTTFIEADVNQANLLQQTASQLGLKDDNYNIIVGKAEQVFENGLSIDLSLNKKSKTYQSLNDKQDSDIDIADKAFDLVFIDPPYALQLCPVIIKKLKLANYIDENSLLYIEDNQTIEHTLATLPFDYELLKTTSVGQVVGSIVQITNNYSE